MADLKQNSRVTATVAGRPLGEWETFTGGNPTGEPTKRRSGPGRTLKQYGALQDWENVTVTRVYENVRDHAQVIWLRTVGAKAPASVAVQELDGDGNNFGASVVYSGMLIAANGGDTDVTSADARMVTLTLQIASVR